MPRRFWGWLELSAAVIALDQLTKYLVLDHFRLGESLPITGFFNLVFVYNTGAAFSFLAGAGGWQRWFFVVLALAVSGWIVWMLKQHWQETGLAAALALIMGGALGNVIDRFAYGAVVDFLDFHVAGWHWPAFNVADMAITCGAALIIFDQFRRKETAQTGSAAR
jgi:signal peptidase II